MKFRPIQDFALVRLDSEEEQIGSLHIPEDARHAPRTGVIVAIGPGKMSKKGRFAPTQRTSGERVMFAWATGRAVIIGGVEHIIIREGVLGDADGNSIIAAVG